MREFKNSKARELFLESLRLDKVAQEKVDTEVKCLGVALDTTLDIFTEAAGLRALADDIEDGLIDEDEIEI